MKKIISYKSKKKNNNFNVEHNRGHSVGIKL